jgi:PAS domain S-box-containing protein
MDDISLAGPDACYWVEAAPIAIALFDADMRYLAASQKWCRQRDTSSDRIRGTSHYEVFPDLPAHWIRDHQRALAGETVLSEKEAIRRRDGSYVWVRWDVRPWWSEPGIVGGIVIRAIELGPIVGSQPADGTESSASAATEPSQPTSLLAGRSILIVAEDPSVGDVLRELLAETSALVLGPFQEINAALDALERGSVDAALLDVDLVGASIFPIADALLARGAPFIFLTSRHPTVIPRRFAKAPVVAKPFRSLAMIEALFD